MNGKLQVTQALDKHSERVTRRNKSVRKGNVVATDPLTVDLYDYEHLLTEDDDLELSQWATLYQTSMGLDVGDVVLVHQENDEWVLTDIVSDTDPHAIGGGERGPQGIQGPPGPAGAMGPIGLAGPRGQQGSQGQAGPAGPAGPTGPVGPYGPQGNAGPTGPAGQSFIYRGMWQSGRAYEIDDVVSASDGSSYICLEPNTGNDPTTDDGTHWSYIAIRGDVGPEGPAGPQGVQGPTGATGPMGPMGVVYDSDYIGTIKQYAGIMIPENWMLCDGAELDRTQYADLYDALGGENSPWGQGDGATTFNIPDLHEQFLLPISTTGNVMGERGGESTHTLTVAEMPSHNHGGTTGTGTSGAWSGSSGAMSANASHAHNSTGIATGAGIAYGSNWAGVVSGTTATNTDHTHTIPSHSHTVPALAITAQGGDGAHNNMPPYVSVAFIVKVTGVEIDSGGGLVGPPGPPGVSTLNFLGEVGTESELDPNAPGLQNGDYYVVSDVSRVFVFVSGPPPSFVDGGPIGAQGPEGPQGPPGPSGAVEVYEQASMPLGAELGAVWIVED